MNIKEAAEELNGKRFLEACSDAFILRLQEAGLVAVFGGGEDTSWIVGSIGPRAPRVEYGAYEGAEYLFTPDGFFTNICHDDDCPYGMEKTSRAAVVRARWYNAKTDYELQWIYETDIPHQTFIMTDGDKPFCEGIVFAVKDAVIQANSIVSRTAEIIGEGDLVFPEPITPATQAFLEENFPDCDDPRIVRLIALAINTERSRCFLVAETEPEYPSEWTQEEIAVHADMGPLEVARGAARDTKQRIMDRIASGEVPRFTQNT